MTHQPLRSLVRAAYRSIRFHDGCSLPTLLESLAALQEQPKSPCAIASIAVEVLPELNARDVARTFSACAQFGCSDEAVRVHFIKNFVRRRHCDEHQQQEEIAAHHLLLKTLQALDDDAMMIVVAEGWQERRTTRTSSSAKTTSSMPIESSVLDSADGALEHATDLSNATNRSSENACGSLVLLISAARSLRCELPASFTLWLIDAVGVGDTETGTRSFGGSAGGGSELVVSDVEACRPSFGSLATVCRALDEYCSAANNAPKALAGPQQHNKTLHVAMTCAIVAQLNALPNARSRVEQEPGAAVDVLAFILRSSSAEASEGQDESSWAGAVEVLIETLHSSVTSLVTDRLCDILTSLTQSLQLSSWPNESSVHWGRLRELMEMCLCELSRRLTSDRLAQQARHCPPLVALLSVLLQKAPLSIADSRGGSSNKTTDDAIQHLITSLDSFLLVGLDFVLASLTTAPLLASLCGGISFTTRDAVNLLELVSHLSVAVNKYVAASSSPSSTTPGIDGKKLLLAALCEVLFRLRACAFERVESPILFSKKLQGAEGEAVEAFALATALDPFHAGLGRLAQVVVDTAPRLSERSLTQLLLVLQHYPHKSFVMMQLFPALIQLLQSCSVSTALIMLRAVVDLADGFSNPQLDYAVLNFFNIHTFAYEQRYEQQQQEEPIQSSNHSPPYCAEDSVDVNENTCQLSLSSTTDSSPLTIPSVSPLVDFVTFAAERRANKLNRWERERPDVDEEDPDRPHSPARRRLHHIAAASSFVSRTELGTLLPLLAALDDLRKLSLNMTSSPTRISADGARGHSMQQHQLEGSSSSMRQLWSDILSLHHHEGALDDVWRSLTTKMVHFILHCLEGHPKCSDDVDDVTVLISALIRYACILRREGALSGATRVCVTRCIIVWVLQSCEGSKTKPVSHGGNANSERANSTAQFCSVAALTFQWLAGEPAASSNLLRIEERAVPTICMFHAEKASHAKVDPLNQFLDDRHEVITAFSLVANMVSSRDVRALVPHSTARAIANLAGATRRLVEAHPISLTSSVSSTSSIACVVSACCELLCFAAVSRAADQKTSAGDPSWTTCLRTLQELAEVCLGHIALVPAAHTAPLRHVCHRLSIVCPEMEYCKHKSLLGEQ